MAMSVMKEAWLERFGGCETLENTPAVIAELDKRALDGMPIGSYVWSELEKQYLRCTQSQLLPLRSMWSQVGRRISRYTG